MIKYGLYNFPNLISAPKKDLNNNLFLPVRVVDIILDDNHPDWDLYGGWDSLGLIKFIPFTSDIKNVSDSIGIARPLFSNIKNYPLLTELTWVIKLPNPESVDNINYVSYYYINTINIWNHPHHNALPLNILNNIPEEQKLSYQEVESGIQRSNETNENKVILGSTFKEQSNIKPLLPYEGDVIHEGRFGQSIRFGSSKEGKPIIIIRNGQSSSSKEGWVPTIENVNTDPVSMFMVQDQIINIKVASTNLQSFGDNLLINNGVKDEELQLRSNSNIQKEGEVFFIPPDRNDEDHDQESQEIESKKEKYKKEIIMNESDKTKNKEGEYALYRGGAIIGYSPIVYIGGIRVAVKYETFVKNLIAAAQKEGINLKLQAGLRTWDEQMYLRKLHVKDKTKVNDIKYLTEAPSSEFYPVTGKPGFSNHQNGQAYDFNTEKKDVYKWMVANAPKFGFVRTVLSERWHWEYIPGVDKFAYVPKSNPTWDNLV